MPIPPIVPRSAAALLCGLLLPVFLAAQTAPDINQILERLDRLEQQNRALADEVHHLRDELAAARSPASPAPAPLDEKVAVQESRVDELAQSKVESSQHFPLRITGVALFNAYLNSQGSGGKEYPLVAFQGDQGSGGGGLRQTTIGLEYSGPRTFLGGQVHGSVFMDFWGGSGARLDQDFRLRTGEIAIDWTNTGIMAGVDSPIFAPRHPDSLAQVAFAPLTGAGNLWLWIPQVRVEQKVHFTSSSGVRAQLGVVQTSEGPSYQQIPGVEPARPGVEGRFNFFYNLDDTRHIEFAPGFHVSTTHADGMSIPSSLFSLDWFANPWAKVEFSGAFFSGQNVANLGGLPQGFTVYYQGEALPVHATGGWAQLAVPVTGRLTFHLFSGLEDDRNSDLAAGAIGRNWLYGANFFYRLAPNVLLGLETSQARTTYISKGYRLNNHYDLALAYLF